MTLLVLAHEEAYQLIGQHTQFSLTHRHSCDSHCHSTSSKRHACCHVNTVEPPLRSPCGTNRITDQVTRPLDQKTRRCRRRPSHAQPQKRPVFPRFTGATPPLAQSSLPTHKPLPHEAERERESSIGISIATCGVHHRVASPIESAAISAVGVSGRGNGCRRSVPGGTRRMRRSRRRLPRGHHVGIVARAGVHCRR